MAQPIGFSKFNPKIHISVGLNRNLSPGFHPLTHLVSGLEDNPVFQRIFPDLGQAEKVLKTIRANLVDRPYEMSVSNDTGDISIGHHYLQTAPAEILYVDILHELVHVRQHFEGRNLYDRSLSYVDRPTEIEAYEICVAEARRIGMTDSDLAAYLDLPWITPEEHLRLMGRLGVSP